jgi:hypothetical protein
MYVNKYLGAASGSAVVSLRVEQHHSKRPFDVSIGSNMLVGIASHCLGCGMLGGCLLQ